MLPRPMRRPIAVLASLGLLAALAAVPVAADSHFEVCATQDTSSGDVADGVTITYDSSFVCTDAPETGEWSITVEVANDAASTDAVVIEDVTLSHTTPRPGGEGPEATATAGELPDPIEPGATGSFDVTGAYELAAAGEGDHANLHLRVSGTTADGGEFFMLGVTVQLLAPGVEPDLNDDADGEGNGNGEGAGRPEWVPGPPPWVRALLEAIFTAGFPWGTDDFPPAIGAQDGENGENGENGEGETGAVDGQTVAEEARPDWVPGPPPEVPGDDGGDEEDGDGPPAFVPPAGGPPESVPGPPAGAGGRP